MTEPKLTKKRRLEICQEIIDRCPIGAEFPADDLALYNEMCGKNWKAAKHLKNPEWPSDPRHVHVLYEDGAWRPFSAKKAISPPTDWTELCKVMRGLAAELAEEFRQEAEQACAFADRGGCNGPLQADHCGLPFDDIALAFVGDFGTPDLIDGPPGSGKMFKSMDMQAAWVAFHQQRAVYQMLCRSHNASKGKRGDKK
jgi:hypothetical protein